MAPCREDDDVASITSDWSMLESENFPPIKPENLAFGFKKKVPYIMNYVMSTARRLAEPFVEMSNDNEFAIVNNDPSKIPEHNATMPETSERSTFTSIKCAHVWRGPFTHKEILALIASRQRGVLNQYVRGRLAIDINVFTPAWKAEGRAKTKNDIMEEDRLISQKTMADEIFRINAEDFEVFKKGFVGTDMSLEVVEQKWVREKRLLVLAKKAEDDMVQSGELIFGGFGRMAGK